MAQGKTPASLETIEEQLTAVATIPFSFHIAALRETLAGRGFSADLMETTKILYLQGNTAMMLPLIRLLAPDAYQGKGYASFQYFLLEQRNRSMVERAIAYLEQGNAFVAVGALHLPGETGLVSLLRKAGYVVEAVSPEAG
jgi:uncharacterized protein